MILKRTEYGTDGNVYELSISNGNEYMTPKMIPIDVLDKIRAEIDGLTYYWCEVNPRSVIDDVLKIIDKYKAESEDI